MPMPGAVSSVNSQRSRERLQCRLRHYMHFLSPAKHSASGLATSVCELRHGGLRSKLHASRKNSPETCAAALGGKASSRLDEHAGGVTVGNSYSDFREVAGRLRDGEANFSRDLRERRASSRAISIRRCVSRNVCMLSVRCAHRERQNVAQAGGFVRCGRRSRRSVSNKFGAAIGAGSFYKHWHRDGVSMWLTLHQRRLHEAPWRATRG
jgi:hypothetical protein